METIVFPDGEQVAIERLVAELPGLGHAGTHVGSKVPNPRPSEFVVVQRTGGVRANLVTDAPLLTIECWADTKAAAQDLGQHSRAVVYALEGVNTTHGQVYKVNELAGLQYAPDEESTHERYLFGVELKIRGAATA